MFVLTVLAYNLPDFITSKQQVLICTKKGTIRNTKTRFVTATVNKKRKSKIDFFIDVCLVQVYKWNIIAL